MRLRQIAVPGHLLGSLVAVAVSPWVWQPLLWPAFYLALLSASSVFMAARHRSLSGLLVGPVALVMHTAWAMGIFSGCLAHREARWRPEVAVHS
jgi:succinoglycan biosynthesis protein ExoA